MKVREDVCEASTIVLVSIFVGVSYCNVIDCKTLESELQVDTVFGHFWCDLRYVDQLRLL